MSRLSAPTAFQVLASPSKTMIPVERALLIVNRTSGTGHGEAIADNLSLRLKRGLEDLARVRVERVSDHAAARACAAEFVAESEAPALVVAGGGGGTLRAVIEGLCSTSGLPAPQRVRVAALRMGSGNVLAKQFGVPHDPIVALDGLLTNLKADRTVPCCVMRCETWTNEGKSAVHHAATLGGLGQFGRIPSDLARWHARFPTVHKTAARLGIEKFTNLEYALTLLGRSVSCVLLPRRAEMVEIQFQGQTERLRLFSGMVMNFPIPALPFNPGVTVRDEALAVYLIPWGLPRTRRIRIEKNQRLEIRFVDRECVEFFLDEDPVTTYKQLTLSVAGSLAFVPGPDYQS